MIDKVLIRTLEVVLDYPVEVTFSRGEFDIDPIISRINDSSGRPIEI